MSAPIYLIVAIDNHKRNQTDCRLANDKVNPKSVNSTANLNPIPANSLPKGQGTGNGLRTCHTSVGIGERGGKDMGTWRYKEVSTALSVTTSLLTPATAFCLIVFAIPTS
jgi:hypothetical protein